MNWLPHYMQKAGVNQNRLAKLAGTTRQQIGKLIKPCRDIGRDWAEKLAPFVNATAAELLFGPEVSGANSRELAPVAGESAAGLWREVDQWDEEKYPAVPVMTDQYPTLPKRAYRIEGPSMDQKRIFDGDFVLTVPYWEARTKPLDGDIVIVERRKGQLVETTCKQVALTPSGVQLWPRSTDPRYQEPLSLPANPGPPDGLGEAIEIVALVIGRFGHI